MTNVELERHGAELAQAFHDGVSAGMEAGAELMNSMARKAVLECIASLPKGSFARREMEQLHGRIEMLTLSTPDTINY